MSINIILPNDLCASQRTITEILTVGCVNVNFKCDDIGQMLMAAVTVSIIRAVSSSKLSVHNVYFYVSRFVRRSIFFLHTI